MSLRYCRSHRKCCTLPVPGTCTPHRLGAPLRSSKLLCNLRKASPGDPISSNRFHPRLELAMFFRRSMFGNNTQTTSTLKEPSTTMSSTMDITPNERQQTFINIANSSFNTNPYRLQYELGGMAIEAIVSNNPFCPLEIVYCTKCFLYNPPSTIHHQEGTKTRKRTLPKI